MSVRVRIDGMGTLQRALLRVTEEGAKAVKREVKRAALNVQAGAKRRAPVDTGRLRNSIATEELDGGAGAAIGTNVEYAPHVEFGTRRQAPKPYLLPAFEEERPQFLARLKREFRDAIVRGST